MKDNKINLEEDLKQDSVVEEEEEEDYAPVNLEVDVKAGSPISEPEVDSIKDEVRNEIERAIMAEKKEEMKTNINKEVVIRQKTYSDYFERYKVFRNHIVEQLGMTDLELKTADSLISDFKEAISNSKIPYASKLRFAAKALKELKELQRTVRT